MTDLACCPKCHCAWKRKLRKHGYTCQRCGTRYDVMGKIIEAEKPKPKGIPAGRITIPQYVYRGARSNRGGE